MWRELVEGLLRQIENRPRAEFNRPAGILELIGVEERLSVNLPVDLKSLLKETNGISDEYGCNYVWDVVRIEQDNLQLREDQKFKQHYMPFDNLLFFGDAGNGDQFAFVILNGEILRKDVFV